MILSFDTFKGKFNYRVAGVAIRDNKVLLNKLENESFWFLPGGRVELGETSQAALKREFFEEIKAQIQINNLKFIIENFFEHSRKIFHEIGLYYDVQVSMPVNTSEFFGVEGDKRLIYKWFSIDELSEIEIQPTILKKKLFQVENNEFHMIIDDR